jgi:hypothetical protein
MVIKGLSKRLEQPSPMLAMITITAIGCYWPYECTAEFQLCYLQ